jgi:hypothetical protein
MDYEVAWIEDGQVKGNPYNKHGINRNTKSKEEYDKEVNSIWIEKFRNFEGKGEFDFFFAIDGLMVSSFFFEELKRRNPHIKTRLYLYDRIEGNYELDCFFPYYDRIFTFDKGDSEKFNINHLPIYWIPSTNESKVEYDVFGMGSYDGGIRYYIFKRVKEIVESAGLRDNIHLWYPHNNNKLLYLFNYIIKALQGRKIPSLSQLNNGLFTDSVLKPDAFRNSIYKSKVILDTHLSYQDGLTARFMWALGAEKKIITTNESVKNYAFYTRDQIYLYDNDDEKLLDFIKRLYTMSDEIRFMIQQYRIDNWLDTILKN